MIKVLKENKNLPMEGFFWIINDKVIGYAKEVPQYNYSYSFEGKTHKNTWINFSKDYLVDNKEVPFDYFPRGRVMVDPNYDKENTFKYFTIMIMMDPCLFTNKYKQMILDYYNLELPNCLDPMWPNLNNRAGIDHYMCHNCKGE